MRHKPVYWVGHFGMGDAGGNILHTHADLCSSQVWVASVQKAGLEAVSQERGEVSFTVINTRESVIHDPRFKEWRKGYMYYHTVEGKIEEGGGGAAALSNLRPVLKDENTPERVDLERLVLSQVGLNNILIAARTGGSGLTISEVVYDIKDKAGLNTITTDLDIAIIGGIERGSRQRRDLCFKYYVENEYTRLGDSFDAVMIYQNTMAGLSSRVQGGSISLSDYSKIITVLRNDIKSRDLQLIRSSLENTERKLGLTASEPNSLIAQSLVPIEIALSKRTERDSRFEFFKDGVAKADRKDLQLAMEKGVFLPCFVEGRILSQIRFYDSDTLGRLMTLGMLALPFILDSEYISPTGLVAIAGESCPVNTGFVQEFRACADKYLGIDEVDIFNLQGFKGLLFLPRARPEDVRKAMLDYSEILSHER